MAKSGAIWHLYREYIEKPRGIAEYFIKILEHNYKYHRGHCLTGFYYAFSLNPFKIPTPKPIFHSPKLS